jgi:hypothetical protein
MALIRKVRPNDVPSKTEVGKSQASVLGRSFRLLLVGYRGRSDCPTHLPKAKLEGAATGDPVVPSMLMDWQHKEGATLGCACLKQDRKERAVDLGRSFPFRIAAPFGKARPRAVPS